MSKLLEELAIQRKELINLKHIITEATKGIEKEHKNVMTGIEYMLHKKPKSIDKMTKIEQEK